jgi:hypothetical protein
MAASGDRARDRRLMRLGTGAHRAPALAAAAWHALLVSFTIALALGVSHLAEPTGHLHAGLVSVLRSCGLAPGVGSGPGQGVRDALAIALPAVLVLALLGQFAIEVVRGHRLRSHHRYVLDVVGATPSGSARPSWPTSGRPSSACPGAGCAWSSATGRCACCPPTNSTPSFWWLPLARHARDETALLLEMTADDRALRRHPHDVQATAMYEMAAGRTRAPQGAFGVGGSNAVNAVIRLRRVLAQQPQPHPAPSASMGTITAALPLLPLLAGCTIGLGLLPL